MFLWDELRRIMSPPLLEDQDSATGFDRFEAIKAIGDDNRASILADIAGHPEGLPTMKELELLNPDVTRQTLIERLEPLLDAGVVEKVEYRKSQRQGTWKPYTYYHITADARALLDDANLFDVDVWRDVQEQIAKTEEHERYESLDRPDVE